MHTFTTRATLRRYAAPLAVTTGAMTGGENVQRLISYGVPLPLIAACGLAVFATVYTAVRELVARMCAETHRCAAPGCTFRVRLTEVDAGESRRWQEIAAAHPAHTEHRP